ncbi:glycosyltransferase family 2 protein [Rhodococcus erythropolis]|uniref:glycosyltransferase family 2 protein n=1 Tax=Rhodococcus erythropolis TaxID=1833 RepID=UPI0036DDD404
MDIGTLSVVVPVYNEEDYIAGCLESLARQGDEILEIIVIDNNSTDRTPEIARSFEQRDSRIRYLVEPRQGVVHARNAGFDIAVGEFIGRVDADSRVAPGWARAVRSSFASHDLDAVTGFSLFYESPFSGLQRAAVKKAEARGDFHGIKPAHALTGSNMAIRATSWRSIRDKVSDRTDIHEDVDLSLCLVKAGMQFGTDLDMRSEISGRRGETGPIEFLSYNKASVTTLEYHQAMTTRLRLMILKTSILHALLWPAYRMYDRQTDRLSWRKLLSGSGARTMPVDS